MSQRRLALVSSLPALLLGCNVALGVDDHEAVPPNCGVDGLEGATAGFADVRTGHCYSVVTHTEPANRDFAGNACTSAGGYLACINDEAEFDLLNRNVIPSAWLGMRFMDGQPAGCDNGESFDTELPIWRDDTPGEAGCTVIRSAAVDDEGCGSTQESWVCELEIGESR